jgi:SAM-dependent methyltransferase
MAAIPGVTDTKFAFAQHLARLGFEIDAPPDVVRQMMTQCLGPQRAHEFHEVCSSASSTGADGQNAMYDFVRTLREANLLRSVNTGVTLDTSYFLYDRARPFLDPASKVIELGCWTGALASFIAEQHPSCDVVGVDRAAHIIELNRQLYNFPNLAFCQWDYRTEKPGRVEPANLLLCGLGTTYACPPDAYCTLDPRVIRQSAGYQLEFSEAFAYFSQWRQAATSEARLLAVLRVNAFPRFLAFIDAAHAAGWEPALDEFGMVHCPSNHESIPFLSFVARESALLSEDILLSRFVFLQEGVPFPSLSGPAALAMFRSFGDRTVLASRDCKGASGPVVMQELGVSGAFAYVFTRSTAQMFELLLLPRWRADHIRQVFSCEDGAERTVPSKGACGLAA